EWCRLEVIAQNLANANTSSGTAAPYQAQTLLSGPKGSFAVHLNGAASIGSVEVSKLEGVETQGLATDPVPPRMVHEPGNPNADAQGMVAYPAIDHAAQMTSLVVTARAYEADLVAMNMAREMYSKALQLGARS